MSLLVLLRGETLRTLTWDQVLAGSTCSRTEEILAACREIGTARVKCSGSGDIDHDTGVLDSILLHPGRYSSSLGSILLLTQNGFSAIGGRVAVALSSEHEICKTTLRDLVEGTSLEQESDLAEVLRGWVGLVIVSD